MTVAAHSTDYRSTFISVAEDCPTSTGVEPPAKEPPTVARIQYDMLTAAPYGRTSDDIVYASNGARRGIDREEFFSKGQPCLRASPLAKRYGWGLHFDPDGHVAMYPLGSAEYKRLSNDPEIQQLTAMRSSKK
ncbi:MAG: hypothetical protein GX868_18120 [Actinobacteria bacterium]|nr:hypothetical protein [Actinomycetota bacterium]